MSRPRSRPRSVPKQVAPVAPAPPKRGSADLAQYATELERELEQLRAAMEQQKREFEEESESFPPVLARLAHSERALGQTKTKLIAAEEAAEQSDLQLASLRTRVQEAEAKLQHCADSERELRSEVSSLRDALAAALEREPSFQRVEQELQGELAELRQALAGAHRERDNLLGALGAIELMSQRIGRISREPQAVGAAMVDAPGPDSDDRRATLRPVAVSPTREAPRSLRRVTPEITVDGVPLVR
jgi:chromosome segregation ATPase